MRSYKTKKGSSTVPDNDGGTGRQAQQIQATGWTTARASENVLDWMPCTEPYAGCCVAEVVLNEAGIGALVG
jgi:hypothetical protein